MTNLGIILGSETKAQKLLRKIPINNLVFMTSKELQEAGLPYRTAQRLESAVALVNEAMRKKKRRRTPLLNAADVYEWVMNKIGTLPREETFWQLCLDVKQRPLGLETIALGGISETNVQVRRIIRNAFALNAARLIFIHNHPSGDPEPSPDDIDLTEGIAKLINPLEITVVDHIILGQGDYVSMAQQGII
ncbi:MAG: hypothetical protein PF689_03090 [Deltaproteobacteria bacterium]|jgi:DNA repair protein RadC|nr:hypothetical protein [Deltaproteobacteria bacterium]